MKSLSKNQPKNHCAPQQPAPESVPDTELRRVPPVLVAHVLNTLPDSLARREELLQALAASIPPNQESAVWVRSLQFHLEEHQRLRLEWPCATVQP